jgi:hypothetical protein
MAEDTNRSLIRRFVNPVEKAEPGAKRILSGVIADTLALVKKERLKDYASLRELLCFAQH